jgi:DNA-binding MarR family transcriptional regulator
MENEDIRREKITFEMFILFIRISKKFQELEKMSIDIGSGEKLYPSELHVIDAIGNEYGNNVTELSKKFGITKGAVSQVVNKLYDKDFLIKERKSIYGKEVVLSLSEKGLKAFKIQDDLHKKRDDEFFKYLGTVEHDKIVSFMEIMGRIEDFIDRFLSHEQQ